MAAFTPLKLVALLVFLAAVAGATYGVTKVVGGSLGTSSIGVDPARATLNATPGHSVTYALTVHNRATDARDVAVNVSGVGSGGASDVSTVFGGKDATVFVTIALPAGLAPGDYPLTVRVLDSAGATLRQKTDALTLHVLNPAPGFALGDSAQVLYTGRIAATGRVFNTDDAMLKDLVFPKEERYAFSPGVLKVESVPRPTVVDGFLEGVMDMQPGESRTVTFGPEKGYGNATLESRTPREESFDRVETLALPGASLSLAEFSDFLNKTGQGNASDYHAGSLVTNPQNGAHYHIENYTSDTVDLRLDVHVGENYTVYPFWPNASQVVSVSAYDATFQHTPALAPDQTFTFFTYWPNMSTIKSINETTIVVRHSPDIGFPYNVKSQTNPTGTDFTVKALTDTEVVSVTPSTAPLAGKTLTFDIEMISLTKKS